MAKKNVWQNLGTDLTPHLVHIYILYLTKMIRFSPCSSGAAEEAAAAKRFGLVGGGATEESAPAGDGRGRRAEAAERRSAGGRGRSESSGAEAERGRFLQGWSNR